MRGSSLPPTGQSILPVLPLRNSVLFPASVVPVNVGRARSVRLVEAACGDERPAIAVLAQRRPQTEEPTFDDLHPFGTVARILKVIRLSSGNYSIVLQGVSRLRLVDGLEAQPYLKARIERIHEPPVRDVELDALASHLRESARNLSRILPEQSKEGGRSLDNVKEPGALADLVASHLPVGNDAKQEILETLDVRERLRKVLDLVSRQSEVHRVKKQISTMVQDEMSRSQREYLLRQQMRAIKRELGEGEDDEDEIEALRERIVRADMPPEAENAARKQIARMRNMPSASAEYHLARTYVEWLTDVPWRKMTPDRLNVTDARRVLDEDHHGLERVKRRILEFLAVRKLRGDVRGPILCFVGPPGVGKTSLGRSIARAMGRNFTRISLGGVQDEAEIRGHRRTYVGAFPGRIINGLKKVGSRNPVMVLDEVDKLGSDYRGDPSSALLEVLDPEQNNTFVDHYIDVPMDLSQVMFIATANRKDTITPPLLDRMELIELPGYTREEKKAIAGQFLVPKQLQEHGLTPERLEIDDSAVERVVDNYTNEAGVRQLERQMGAICRAVAVRLAEGEDVQMVADGDYVEKILGAPRHRRQQAERVASTGLSTSLAWTPAGGDLLFVEASRKPGNGTVHLTGQMGDVMQESAHAAFTFLRTRAEKLGLPPDFLSHIDVHVHLPQGSIPKDGPSAGIAVFVSLTSMLTRLKVRPDVAMTGEMTLRGTILKVNGIKEKCLAAHRAGIRQVILPKRNEPDLDEVPDEIRRDLDIRLVSRVEEVLDLALIREEPQATESSAAPAAPA
ncbi:MAG: endopeptidase La [Myxococcota bacterium]